MAVGWRQLPYRRTESSRLFAPLCPVWFPFRTNFNSLEKAFRNGDIALIECRDRRNGEPAYVICVINLHRQADRGPEIEMVPFGLMFNNDPCEMLIPAFDPEFDDLTMKRK
jgi:Family of unknown function (DUF6117)